MNSKEEDVAEVMDDLAQAVGLTKAMLAAVQAGKWDTVHTLSAQRMQCLERFFSHELTPELASDVEPVIRSIQSLDQRITVFCDAEREQLVQQLNGLKKQKAGTAAYQAQG